MRGDISGAVNYEEDLDAVNERAVDNDVGADGEASKFTAEVWPPFA